MSACSKPSLVRPPVIQTQVQQITVPRALLTCPEIPLPPDPDTPDATQRSVAVWAPDIVSVAELCKSNLGAVRRIIDKAAADAAKRNADG